MTEPFHHEGMELPDDLKALDAELASIRYEERPSFGPELRAELARAHAEEPVSPPSFGLRRGLVAAGLAAILVGTAAVPSARASLVRLFDAFGPVTEPVEVLLPVVESAGTVVEAEAAEVEPAVPVEDVGVSDPVSTEEASSLLEAPVVVRPELLDRARSQQLLQDAYPIYLQRRGVGGTVWLRLWIDETGLPGDATVLRSSGSEELDRTALRVAPRFTFTPARQGDDRFGTWIQFPVLFEPDPELLGRELRPAVDPLGLPTVPRDEWWQLREPLDLATLPEQNRDVDALERGVAEADLLRALPDQSIAERYGPLSAILEGAAPEGNAPADWRSVVGSSLAHAIDLGMETPSSLLAFGRIRLRQGLRTEARSHFERGLQMAMLDGASVSAWVVAELHFERARLIREHWLASEGVGRVDASAFRGARCEQARSSGGADFGFASAERLIAWNYLCPSELARVMDEGFEPSSGNRGGDLTLMMASYRAAVESYPGHQGANTDLLVTLALEQRWDDLLRGARRFAHTSGGHPTALLLAGLALHRVGETDDAAEHFAAGLERMSVEGAAELTDVGFLLDRDAERAYRDRSAAERRVFNDDFWATRDRTPSSAVNERWVEHMARASLAFLRYGGVFGDAGEVWVRFGGPKSIHIIDDGGGRLTEFWDYGNSGPDITFVRWVSSERTDLTPEGRAYIDDLGKIFPPQ